MRTILSFLFFSVQEQVIQETQRSMGITFHILKPYPVNRMLPIHYLKITEYDTGILIGIKAGIPSINISEDSFKEISIAERDSTGYVLKVTIDDLTIRVKNLQPL